MTQADVAESCFDRLGIVEDIVKAVECRRRVLSLLPDGHGARRYHLSTLGSLLLRRFSHLGDLADISQAIKCLSHAIQLTPDHHPNKANWLDELGNGYMRQFEGLGELADVDKAIECQTQVVLLTPHGHANKPRRLNNLGISHLCRFKRLGELEDVVKAIECHTRAVLLTPNGHADKPGYLNSLGNSHLCRFEHMGEVADVDKAIECQTQAVLLTPNGHAEKPGCLNSLGNAHRYRFWRLGEVEDVDNAIECQTQAVLLTPNSHPDKPTHLNDLGNSYGCRFKHLGELADVEKAIECHTHAVLLTPKGHAGKPGDLNNLGNSHGCRFEHLGKLADVDKAIECQTQAVLLTPNGHPEQPARLNNLGISHQRRFRCLGELPDVDKAIESQTEAVLLTPNGHANKPALLNNLGHSYLCRFRRLGEVADVDKAIECQTQAVLPTPNCHAHKHDWLTNLGNSYQFRFERLGELADVDKAIECHTQAVLLCPNVHARKPTHLNNLGNSHLCRFNRLGELADVDKAIECQTQAVLLTPNSHPDKPGWLSNLGVSHQCRFQRLRGLADVDKAIECQTQAVLLTPNSHADKPARLNNLGDSYQCRFQCLGEVADVGKAIECQTQAVLLTPNGHADKPAHLNNLGNGNYYMARFQHHGMRVDLESANSSYQNAAQHIITNPKTQLHSARSWATSMRSLELSPLLAYQRCIELVPHLIWLGSTIDQRYGLLTTVSDLATEAAAWAISVQAHDLAIEWLEQGRSVVWNQILHLRTPCEDLDAVDHALARRLQIVASQLEGAGTRPLAPSLSNPTSSDLEKDAQHHRRLAGEWERLIGQARSLPGFHNFMRPRMADELKLAATDGPVILINTHSTRWDALIIFPQCENVVHVPLSTPLQDDAGEPISQLYPTSLGGNRGERAGGFGRVNQRPTPDSLLKATLAALWIRVVKPIMDALACTHKLPVAELPHVTWCATGELASAALHAAGLYDGSCPSTFDLVISSYTPTLSALLAASVPSSDSDVGLLAVGQKHTRGFSSLPSTVPELAAIKRTAKATRYLQLDGHDASVDAVLRAMDEHSWVHFACHATQNTDNPAHSAFHLSDGSLTLEAITKRHYKNKDLAFLSACQTAKGDGKLPDEAVHLAAGMLMAGYPSVVATMWSIWDIDGPEVAKCVYAELFTGDKMTRGGVARALHMAVDELRRNIGEESFERWVPFIHIGL